MPTSGNEFYYDKDGKKQDTAIHEPILKAGNKKHSLKHSREHAAKLGVPPEGVRALFGDE
jgi:hypothetical protein